MELKLKEMEEEEEIIREKQRKNFNPVKFLGETLRKIAISKNK